MSDKQDEPAVPVPPIETTAPEVSEPRPDVETTDAPAAADPVPDEAAAPTQLRLRRAPRYRPFGLTGALIGVIAGLILALSFTAAANYTIQTIAGYFAAIFGLIGAVLGLSLAVLIERRRS